MKFKKRMISLLLAVLLVFNSIPAGGAGLGAEVSVKEKLTDFIADIEYGWTGGDYRFPADVLDNVEEGHDVYLTATAALEKVDGIPQAGTDVKVTFTNFAIAGADAQYYVIPDLTGMTAEKTVKVLPKTLKIRPATTQAYYGQDLPEDGKVSVSEDYKKQLVGDDSVTVTCAFIVKLDGATDVGVYEMEKDGDIVLKGKARKNYEAVVEDEENLKFSILSYTTESIASDGNAEDAIGNQNGKTKATLTAPNGFLISTEGNLDNEGWSGSIEVDLEETDGTSKKEIVYYLRNNEVGTEFYRAICEKTYEYSAMPLPTVTGIEIVPVTREETTGEQTTTTMLFKKDGVFANGDVQAVVYVTGASFEQATDITLVVDGTETTMAATEVTEVDGRYTYKAVFDIASVEDDSVLRVLQAYANNTSGTGAVYPAANCGDTYMNSETPVTMPLVLDRKGPDVVITGIDIEYWFQRIAGSFTIHDDHVGVATLKYAWDNGSYKDYDAYRSDVTEYTSYLYFINAERVQGGLHTLHLIATDALGNTTKVFLKDTSGVDALPPEIISVEIQPSEGVEFQNTSEGIFANGPVTIVVRAKDGIDEVNAAKNLDKDSVTILAGEREYRMTRTSVSEDNVEHEYTFVIDPTQKDVKWENIRIQVTDTAGNDIDPLLTEITQSDGTAKYLSNDLYVENEAPSITISELGVKYGNNDVCWVGSADIDKTINISVTDMPGQIYSGLKTVKITKTKDGVTATIDNWEALKPEALKDPVAINVSSWEDGVWTIKVETEDFCGNTNSDVFTFKKDVVAPESGKIDLKADDQDVVHDVKQIGEADWFAPEISEAADKDGYISFRIGSNSADEKLREIIVRINGGESRTFTYNDSKGWYEAENGGSYIYANTKTWNKNGLEPMAPTDEIPYNHYIVEATLVDKCQNRIDLPARIVYVDKANPKIEKITVQKAKESLVDQIIRILTFGIFSNDDLIFNVYTYDGKGDSGMKSVNMQVTDRDSGEAIVHSTENSSVDEDGFTVYSFTVSKGELEKFDSSLAFTAFDRYGKDCTKYPYIDVNENFEVMIERELPSIAFELPTPTGFYQDRTDGQKWYNVDKNLSLQIHDTHSGIYSITLLVNGRKHELFNNPTGIIKDQLFAAEKEADAETNDFDQHFTLFNLEKAVNEDAVSGKNGEYRIAVKVADNSGNVYAEERVYYIDTEKPAIDKISFSVPTADGVQETTGLFADPEGISYGYFFKENFDITVHVSDAAPSSGLHHVRYWLNSMEEAPVDVEVVDGEASVDVPDNFKGQIFYEVLDYAGNSSGVMTTAAYVVDNAAPTIQITNHKTTSYRDGNNNPLYTEANSFTVVVTDTVSGLQKLSYTKSAELHAEEEKTIQIGGNTQTLDDGWEITGREANLITQVKKTFTFGDNDNDICMHFNAMDRSRNVSATVDSETFTIDTIAPVIVVDFGSDNDDDPYYNQNRVATIRVTERNFRADLIKVMIENHFGSVPGYSFAPVSGSNTEYIATINFDEGDYTFDLTGKDLGDHSAVVTFTGGNEKLFYVDKTVPMIVENFWEFANEQEDSFNVDKTAQIKIVEHNFDAGLTNLRITRKAAGGEHSHNGMVDVTKEVLGGRTWTRNGDSYTIEFTFSTDAVYYVEIAPVDLASNQGAKHNTVIFEIDKTVPVVSAKNGEAVEPDDTGLLDIYPYDRRDSAAPTVEFTDNNIASIEYTLITYIPEYLSDGLVQVNPVVERGVVKGSLFTLENFDRDGIYSVELVAVDVAGNRSEVNSNTYARMVNQDVLAFILDSNVTEQTGLFSLEYENGESISKKPYDFKDLRILVMTPAETPIDIVLRDTNGKEMTAEAALTSVESVYGVNVHIFEVSAEFFRENFQDDIDTEMHLTVWNQGYRIDLARIHIDNIAPACDFPQELHSWAWFSGEEDRTFTISNISELLELEDCKVYDNGVEIPFEYSGEDDTLSFTLSKGWHNIGFILCDAAGNANISQEMNNIHIGNFWTIFGVSVGGIAAAALIMALLYRRKRIVQEMLEEA